MTERTVEVSAERGFAISRGVKLRCVALLALYFGIALFVGMPFAKMALLSPPKVGDGLGWRGIAAFSFIVSQIFGFTLGLITVIKRRVADITAPLFAIFKGYAFGGIIGLIQLVPKLTRHKLPIFSSIIIGAVVACCVIIIHKTIAFKITDRFKKAVRWFIFAPLIIGIFVLVIVIPITIFLTPWAASALMSLRAAIPNFCGLCRELFEGIVGTYAVMVFVLTWMVVFDSAKANLNDEASPNQWFKSFSLMASIVRTFPECLILIVALTKSKKENQPLPPL